MHIPRINLIVKNRLKAFYVYLIINKNLVMLKPLLQWFVVKLLGKSYLAYNDPMVIELEVKKQVLFVSPFFAVNASSSYTEQMMHHFFDQGYHITHLVYSEAKPDRHSRYVAKTYYLCPTKSKDVTCHLRQTKQLDIDAWVGPELISFVQALKRKNHFEHCIVNYVFLSAVFALFDNKTMKMLITHDVFTDRNKTILETTNSNRGCFFNTSQGEEKKGLQRADSIVAICQEDKRFFENNLKVSNIILAPYLLKPAFEFFNHRHKNLVIGYIGSLHGPNITALNYLLRTIELTDNTVFCIAGSISSAFVPAAKIRVLGEIDDLSEFYKQVDVIVNPDLLPSGMKVKSLEALAYGKPLISTKAGSRGLPAKSRFHTIKDINTLIEVVYEITSSESSYNALFKESKILMKRYLSSVHLSNISTHIELIGA